MLLNLKPANDNGPAIDAEFLKLPGEFLGAYQQELLAWAGNLQVRGPFLDINLWNAPGVSVASTGYQGQVKLRCDAMGDQQTKHLRLIIQPDSTDDAERVRKHCAELPAIIKAHRAQAEANKGKPRGYVSAVFEKIPDYFVERYGLELRLWGQNLRKIGLTKHIVLREGILSDVSPDEEQGAVLRRVTLVAKVERLAQDRLRLVISPATEADERMIANHCQKLQKEKIPARAQLVEPDRPGLPGLPDYYLPESKLT
jgi:hypothetical protein